MIAGEVSATREIIITFSVRDSTGVFVPIQAVVDKGFDGHLLFPPATVVALGLVQSGDITVILADGTASDLPQYDATIEWDAQTRNVFVLAAEGDPLVGMELLYGFDFHAHVVDGGMVALNRLP